MPDDKIAPALKKTLLSNKKSILNRWTDIIFDDYQADGAKFFRENTDAFRNPVGTAIRKETEVIFDQIVDEMDPSILRGSLDNLLKIRSVQDLTPLEAVSFVFFFKRAIAEEYKSDLHRLIQVEDLLHLHAKIDRLALMAFGIYMECREKINQIRINEIKKRTFSIHEKRIRKENDPGE